MGTLDSSMEERVSIWNAPAWFSLNKSHGFGEGASWPAWITLQESARLLHEHADSLYIGTISSYGIIGTLLLAVSTLQTGTHAFRNESRSKKRQSLDSTFRLYRCTLRSRYLRHWPSFGVQSAFLFLLDDDKYSNVDETKKKRHAT